MNEGFGRDFYRKGDSVKRSGHSVNRRTLNIEKLLSSVPSQKSQLLQSESSPTISEIPENILGIFWLAERLQYVRLQNYRRPVYRPKVVQAIV